MTDYDNQSDALQRRKGHVSPRYPLGHVAEAWHCSLHRLDFGVLACVPERVLVSHGNVVEKSGVY